MTNPLKGAVPGDSSSDEDAARVARRRFIVLLVLGTVTSILNFVDRSILNILAEPIKKALGFSDTQLGLLTGFSFAMFYSLMGLPVARYVDRPRTNRPTVIAACIALWSAMTMISGIVMSYGQLLVARALVAVGEAGSGPSIATLMDDCVPRAMRTRAFAIYSLGVPFGTLLGLVGGGALVDVLGWRMTFLVVGAPGLLLALAVRLMLHEPRAQRLATTPAWDKQPTLADNFLVIVRSPALRWLTAGAAFQGLFGLGLQSWTGVYLIRVLTLSPHRAGLILGLMAGICGGCGTYFGGALADRLSAKDRGRALLVPAFGLLVGIPAALAALLSHDWRMFAAFYWITVLGTATYIGPLLSLLQILVPANYRATTTVVVFMLLNLAGGLGALLIGSASDLLRPHFGAESLRWILMAVQLIAVVPALFYLRASRLIVERSISPPRVPVDTPVRADLEWGKAKT
jgi:predicted MFS family arabinose efflux permease